MIPIRDIMSGRAIIIGRIGVPIGQVVTITGEWQEPSVVSTSLKNRPTPSFVVKLVDGKALTKHQTFEGRDIHILLPSRVPVTIGRRQTFHAFESCGNMGVPATAWDDRGSPIAHERSFGFYSTLLIVRPGDK